jgi:hypothetical protein
MNEEKSVAHRDAYSELKWFACGLLVILSLGVSVRGRQSSPPEIRECKPGFDVSASKKKKPQQSQKGQVAAEAPASQVCLEIPYPDLMIQERLQNYVRAERWNISDEQTSEDTWTFFLLLSKEQLGSYTKPQILPKVTWHGGKASVQVRTSELPDGFTRIVLSARFEGYGKAEDQFAAQRESWPLSSNGKLESSLLSILKLPLAVPSSKLQN